MRITVVAAICLCIVGISTGADAQGAIRKQTNIPAQGLGPALQVLAKDRNLQVVYRSEVIGKLRTEGAAGDLTTDEAITQLLKGTGLTFRYLGESAITIVPVGSSANAVSSPSSSTAIPSSAPDTSDQPPQEGKKSVGAGFRVAQVAPGSSSGGAALTSTQEGSSDQGKLTEIVVSAQKKGDERLQDVPVPVGVIDTTALDQQQQLLIRDYYSVVPGVSFVALQDGGQTFAIRGIWSNNNPTVGVTVDDVPINGSTDGTGGGVYIPDLDPSDLQRIEVLRGPQGTLYGANSMGGLVRYVTIDPSTSEFSGRVETGLSTVEQGSDVGYITRGSVNIPMSDSLAVRISAYQRETPGYIDNVRYDISDVNKADSAGGRVAILWKPTSDFSVKASAMYQVDKDDGYPESSAVTGLSSLQSNELPGPPDVRHTLIATAVVKWAVGGFDLTSISGYTQRIAVTNLDFSAAFGSLVYRDFGVAGSTYVEHSNPNKISEELRAGKTLGIVDFTVGSFYTNENNHHDTWDFLAIDTTTRQVVGNEWHEDSTRGYREYAGFSDAIIHFTPKLDLDLGVRESHLKVSTGTTYDSGPYIGPVSTVTPGEASSENAFTYLIDPRYRISDDVMVYARIATGYRPGGGDSNAAPTATCHIISVPCAFGSDKTTNYEAGTKFYFWDQRVFIDSSIYHIDWKNIQITLTGENGFRYNDNGGSAKSDGVETSVGFKPNPTWSLDAWGDYNKAVLTQAFPASSTVPGASGDPLPIAPKWSGHGSVTKNFRISDQAAVFVSSSLDYVGSRLGPFGTTRAYYPDYTKINAGAGVNYGEWRINAYVDNLADRRGVIGGGVGYNPPNTIVYITPRTVGLNLARTF
jgi:iron complex outermembrane receptor protein